MCLRPLKMKSKHKSCLSAARWSMYTQKNLMKCEGMRICQANFQGKTPLTIGTKCYGFANSKTLQTSAQQKVLPGSESDRASTTGDRPLDPRCDCCNDATLVMSRKAPKSKKRWKLQTQNLMQLPRPEPPTEITKDENVIWNWRVEAKLGDMFGQLLHSSTLFYTPFFSVFPVSHFFVRRLSSPWSELKGRSKKPCRRHPAALF